MRRGDAKNNAVSTRRFLWQAPEGLLKKRAWIGGLNFLCIKIKHKNRNKN